jgi:hypothetical protein
MSLAMTGSGPVLDLGNIVMGSECDHDFLASHTMAW